MKAVLYARSSLGIPGTQEQLALLQQSLKPQDTVVATYVDSSPASIPHRPVLAEALAQLKNRLGQALFVTSLDHLSRNPEDLAKLKEVVRQQGIVILVPCQVEY
jgi:DNA invertase Pin-like site-specific DNA recombinase